MITSTTCPNGHENPPGIKFCGECGTALVLPAPPSEAAEAQSVVGDDAAPAPQKETHEQTRKPRTWTPILGIGLVVGALSGMLGIGGGLLIVPLLLYVPPWLGFDPIDLGPLTASRLLEPLALLWITLAHRQKLGTDIVLNVVRRPGN